MKIILRVRELRKNNNLTQEELAKELNISRQSLISLEQGRWLPSLPLAIQLADFFNSSLEDVIESPNHVNLPLNNLVTNSTDNQVNLVEFGSLPINLWQTIENIFVEAFLPGYKQDELVIDVAEDFIKISGHIDQSDRGQDGSSYVINEYRPESFCRTINLPSPVLKENSTAKLSHGVLSIILPKKIAQKSITQRIHPIED